MELKPIPFEDFYWEDRQLHSLHGLAPEQLNIFRKFSSEVSECHLRKQIRTNSVQPKNVTSFCGGLLARPTQIPLIGSFNSDASFNLESNQKLTVSRPLQPNEDTEIRT